MGPQGHYQLEDGLYEKPRSRKKTYLYSALVLLFLIAAGVGIGVVVSRLTDEDSSPSSLTSDTGSSTSSSTEDEGFRDSQVGEAVSTPGSEQPGDSSSGGSETGTGSSDGGTPPGTKEFPDQPPPVDTNTTAPATPPAPLAPAPPAPVPPATVPPTPAPAPPAPAPPAPAAPVIPVQAPVEAPAPTIPVAPPPPVAPAPVAAPPTLVSAGAPDSWIELPDVPLPMGEVGAGILTLNNKPYYVIAGEHPTEEVAKNGVTMILDLTGGEWYEGAKRPSIGNHHAAEVIGNKLYLFGGLSGGEQDLQIGTLVPGVQGPNIEWQMGAQLPFASGSASTALIGGKVYYCGGIDKANTMTLDTCAVYSPTTDTWATTVAPMPVGRNHAATCTDGKKMFIFGGRSGKNIVGEGFGETQIYDPASNTWQLGTPLAVARGGMGKAVFNAGKCYVFGGEVWEQEAPSVAKKITTDRVSVATDIYTIASDAWSAGEDLPVGIHGTFPVKFNGAAIMGSGGIQAAYSQSQHALAYVF